ncbi:MAG: protein translocase SEC61 complex subunit gamma [Nitrososphaeraceae archaeon]
MNIFKIHTIIQRKILEMYQTLQLAKKTSKQDYKIYMRFVLLGMGVVGGVGFIIKLVGEFISSG